MTWADRLANLIEEAMNSDDEIDRTYLLEAIIMDLRSGDTAGVEDLLANPVS